MAGRPDKSYRHSYYVSRPVHDDENDWARCPACKQWARIEYGELRRHRLYEPGTQKWAWCYGESEV